MMKWADEEEVLTAMGAYSDARQRDLFKAAFF